MLLDSLCVNLGFCLPPADVQRLVDEPPPDARTFTDEVFRAEGVNPELADRRLYRQVRDEVVGAFCAAARHDEVNGGSL